MRQALRILPTGISVALMAAVLGACVKTVEEENKTEIIDGTSQQVRILAGIAASPNRLAQSYCDQYQKKAFLRDAVPEGTLFEEYAEGSRYYIYTFDCF